MGLFSKKPLEYYLEQRPSQMLMEGALWSCFTKHEHFHLDEPDEDAPRQCLFFLHDITHADKELKMDMIPTKYWDETYIDASRLLLIVSLRNDEYSYQASFLLGFMYKLGYGAEENKELSKKYLELSQTQKADNPLLKAYEYCQTVAESIREHYAPVCSSENELMAIAMRRMFDGDYINNTKTILNNTDDYNAFYLFGTSLVAHYAYCNLPLSILRTMADLRRSSMEKNTLFDRCLDNSRSYYEGWEQNLLVRMDYIMNSGGKEGECAEKLIAAATRERMISSLISLNHEEQGNKGSNSANKKMLIEDIKKITIPKFLGETAEVPEYFER